VKKAKPKLFRNCSLENWGYLSLTPVYPNGFGCLADPAPSFIFSGELVQICTIHKGGATTMIGVFSSNSPHSALG
jgi:hypothetical protein